MSASENAPRHAGLVALALAIVGGVLLAFAGPIAARTLIPGVWLGPAFLYASFAIAPARPAPRKGWRGVVRDFWIQGALGFAFGFVCNALTFRFVPDVIVRFTPLPWAAGAVAVVLLAAAHALRFFVVELVYRTLVRRNVNALFAFAVAMYVSTFVPMLFPWTPAGGATAWPIFVQLAEFVGERGVTFYFAFVSALAADGLVRVARERSPRGLARVALALVIFVGITAWGHLRVRQIEAERQAAPKFEVQLVQPLTEARERWDKARAAAILDRLNDLTSYTNADLVVWPEAAYPYSLSATGRRAPVGAYAPIQKPTNTPVLIGALTHRDHESMNSAVIVYPDGTLSEPYHKMHLLWFGETVPLADVWPWLRRNFARGVGLTPGERQVLLEAGAAKIAVLNCFEDTLPAAGREAAALNPNLLVNITNDAWFAGSEESELHMRVAAMRAVETRRDMVRAVNYGMTSHVDARGFTHAFGAYSATSYVVTTALLSRPPTLYVRFGDIPWALLLAVITVGLVRLRPESWRGPVRPA